jgi:hypothetical protein
VVRSRFRQHDTGLLDVKVDPFLKNVQSHPRFAALLERLPVVELRIGVGERRKYCAAISEHDPLRRAELESGATVDKKVLPNSSWANRWRIDRGVLVRHGIAIFCLQFRKLGLRIRVSAELLIDHREAL